MSTKDKIEKHSHTFFRNPLGLTFLALDVGGIIFVIFNWDLIDKTLKHVLHHFCGC